MISINSSSTIDHIDWFCKALKHLYGAHSCRLRLQRLPTLEEQAKAKWGDVQNNYQRRADLIPNLVATVQGYAKQEREVLTAVVEARAKATQTRVDVSQLTDPETVSNSRMRKTS